METDLRVLIVEESAEDATVVVRGLERGGYHVVWERVVRSAELEAALARPWDLVVAAYSTQQAGGFDTLHLVKRHNPDLPTIVVLASLDEAMAMQALRNGAHDYVMKSHAARLVHAVERARAESAERRSRRQAEAALRASEERYRDLVENANDIIFTTDLDGTFMAVNRAAEILTGYNRSELVGMNMTQLLTPASLQVARQAIGLKLERNQPTWTELELIGRGGKRLLFEVTTRLLYRDGRPYALQGIARDITMRHGTPAEERERIACRLRDDTMATLTEALRVLAGSGPESAIAPADRERIEVLIRQAREETLTLARELHPKLPLPAERPKESPAGTGSE